jgi:hypothetical protein
MSRFAAYDEIADWYESVFLARQRIGSSVDEYADQLGIDQAIVELLGPGGVFVHIGVHPCLCGGFADRSSPEAIVIGPGYLDGAWTTDSWTNEGVRDKVGATHVPLAGLLNKMIAAGLTPEQFSEGGTPTPIVLSARLRKPSRSS